MDLAKFSEYGLLGLMIAAVVFMLWRMLVWVMAWVDKQAAQHILERKAWIESLEGLNNSIQLHNQGSIEARKMTEEAHRYQREEHQKFAAQNDEICKALGRINGYKEGDHGR